MTRLYSLEDEDNKKDLIPVNISRVNNHIYFYDQIDSDTHRVFCQLFEEAKQYIYTTNGASMFEKGSLDESIVLHINSNGGDALDSLALYDYLKSQEIPIVGIVEGMCASGATLMLCGCTVRLMTKHSFALIHELRSGSIGKLSKISDDYFNISGIMDAIKEVYQEETKVPIDKLDEILSHDIYWRLDDCKKYGLVQAAVGEEILPEPSEIKDAIKETEKKLKELQSMLPKKTILSKAKKVVSEKKTPKATSKDKSEK